MSCYCVTKLVRNIATCDHTLLPVPILTVRCLAVIVNMEDNLQVNVLLKDLAVSREVAACAPVSTDNSSSSAGGQSSSDDVSEDQLS